MADIYKKLPGKAMRYENRLTGETISRRQYLNWQRGTTVEKYRDTREQERQTFQATLEKQGVPKASANQASTKYMRARSIKSESKIAKQVRKPPGFLKASKRIIHKIAVGSSLSGSDTEFFEEFIA